MIGIEFLVFGCTLYTFYLTPNHVTTRRAITVLYEVVEIDDREAIDLVYYVAWLDQGPDTCRIRSEVRPRAVRAIWCQLCR